MRPSGSQFLAWGCAVWTSGNLSRDVESRWQRNVGNIDACLPVKYGARILTVWCDMHQIASSQLGPVHSTTCCDVFLRQKGAINTHTQTNTQTHTHKHTHTHTNTHTPTHPRTHARTDKQSEIDNAHSKPCYKWIPSPVRSPAPCNPIP